MRWRADAELLRRWKEGATGWPLVDANMRELAATGGWVGARTCVRARVCVAVCGGRQHAGAGSHRWAGWWAELGGVDVCGGAGKAWTWRVKMFRKHGAGWVGGRVRELGRARCQWGIELNYMAGAEAASACRQHWADDSPPFYH